MSKMKHLLRKLHIGGAFNDHNNRLAAAGETSSRPPATAPFPSSSSSSSSPSPLPRFDGTGAVDSSSENENTYNNSAVDFNFFEEEFQMQLALAISVSSGSLEAREPDAETAQIKAAKQRSLGHSPSEPLVEFLSLRYWSNNVINYDEKVMDGFYDVYGIVSNSVTQGKMPLLVDLQAITVSDNVDYEVILVDRTVDKELRQLEERVSNISLECQAKGTGQIMIRLIKRIADIVVAQMGGPVSDADEMLRRWTCRSYELRNSLNSIVLPLGCLDVGLSRHRALLFKVLADKSNLPCSLVKESCYTGTDDGTVNLIKTDNGSEYIIDLMGAPGTLIPLEVPSCNLESFGLDIRGAGGAESFGYPCPLLEVGIDSVSVTPNLGAGTSDSDVTSIVESQCNGRTESTVERNQTERFENDFGKLLPSLSRSHEGISGNDGKASTAQKLQIQDVSKCVISAAKNPEFAQKLHAVLLKNDGTSSDSLLKAKIPEKGEAEVRNTVHLLDADMVNVGAQYDPALIMSKNEQCRIPFTGGEAVRLHHNNNPRLINSGLPAQPKESMSCKSNSGCSSSFELTSTSDDLCVCDTIIKKDPTDNAVGKANAEPSFIVQRILDVKQAPKSSLSSVSKPFERQCGDSIDGCGPFLMNERRVHKTIEERKKLDMKVMETPDIGRPACTTHSDGISLSEVEWEIPWEDLQIGERIGIGSYGEVYRSEWNGTEVAVKKFMNQDLSGDALAQFKGEVEIMLRLRHPNVVLFMGAVTRPPNLSILTEFLPRGSLFKLLHRPNVQLDEKRRIRMALDVAKGMNYLHTSNPIIVHRDLKTPNLLVDKNWVVKVCDFGMSRMKHHTFLSSKSTAGTPEWMAPEVLRNEPSNEKCDIYSFGVILWELATMRVPWTEMNSMQVVGAVGFQHRHLDIPESVNPAVARIITDCWHPEPQSRPSFKEIISQLRNLRRLSVDRTETCTNQY